MAEIRVQNLHKEFGGFVAVRDSSFTVPSGWFFCLLGPSGHLHVAVGGTVVVTLGDPETALAPGDEVDVEMVAPLLFDARGDRVRAG